MTEQAGSQPEVRLELTNAEGRQIWALYSERPETAVPPQPALGRFLEELLSIAWSWRRGIALATAIGAALGGVYLLMTPSVYLVRALVHIEQRDSVLQEYDPVRTASTFIATQTEVLHSPSIVRRTFAAMGGPPQRPAPGIVKRLKNWVRSLLPAASGPPPDLEAAAVTAALAALKATPVLGTEVMAITYRTIDPRAGVAFLDALIERYREYVRELEADAHIEGLDLLRTQAQELGVQFEALQERWDALHATTLALGQDGNAMSVQKMRLEEHARASVAAQGRRIELENRLALLRQNGASLPAKNDQLLGELRAAEASMAELRATVSDRHPDVRRLELKIELLREQIQRNSFEQVGELERELRAAQRTEEELKDLYDREWASAKGLEGQHLQEVELQREMDRVQDKQNSVHGLLRDKELRVLSLQSGHSGTLVRVLDPPAVPPEAVWPIPGMVLLVFAILGALGGLGYALRAEHKHRSPARA